MKSSSRMVVAVDGLAGSGKSTLAKLLAERLGFVFFGTGVLYRSLAQICRIHEINIDDVNAVVAELSQHTIEVSVSRDGTEAIALIDSAPIEGDIRVPVVSEITSKISAYAEVRKRVLALQREAAPLHNLVAEGRDIGTIVFPSSPLKFFIEASEDVRVERRLRQLGLFATTEALNRAREIKMEIVERDRRDKERSVSPTIAAADAIVIDNTSRTLTDVVNFMYDTALARGIQKKEGPSAL